MNNSLKNSLSAVTLLIAGSLVSVHAEAAASTAKVVDTSISALEMAKCVAASSKFAIADPTYGGMNYQYHGPVVDHDCGGFHTHLFAESKADGSDLGKFNV